MVRSIGAQAEETALVTQLLVPPPSDDEDGAFGGDGLLDAARAELQAAYADHMVAAAFYKTAPTTDLEAEANLVCCQQRITAAITRIDLLEGLA